MKSNKDKLEQFISDNKDSFNYHTPSEALRQRIQKELSNRKNQRKSVPVKRIWLYKLSAAAAVLVAVIVIVFYMRNKNEQAGYQPPIVKTKNLPAVDSNKNKENQSVVTEREEKNEETLPGEVNKEDMYHYTRLIEIKQQQMKTLKRTAPELYKEFAGDMEILEDAYKELKEQLKQDGNKEQLMEAMIDNLKMQAALLSKQLEIYKESHSEKQREKTSYDKSFPLRTSAV
jgi:hypothetical protein